MKRRNDDMGLEGTQLQVEKYGGKEGEREEGGT